MWVLQYGFICADLDDNDNDYEQDAEEENDDDIDEEVDEEEGKLKLFNCGLITILKQNKKKMFNSCRRNDSSRNQAKAWGRWRW